MKSIKCTMSDEIFRQLTGFEELTVAEMFKIRGGGDDKSKTKDTDIYDTRNT